VRADPLIGARAVWPEVVGTAMAARSRPVALEGETLVVLIDRSASSAWNEQLAFHEERILAELRARLPGLGAARLKVKSGVLRRTEAPAPPPRRDPVRSLPEAGPPPAAGSAGAALEHLRAAIEARQRAKREAGWKECACCGVQVPPDQEPPCLPCRLAAADARERALARLLFAAPLVSFAEAARQIDGLDVRTYETVRRRLLSRWWTALQRVRRRGALSRDRHERMLAQAYVALKTGYRIERIAEATVRNELGDELYDLLFGRDGERTR